MSNGAKLPILQAAQYSWRFAAASWMPVLPAYLIKALIMGVTFSLLISADPNHSGLGLAGLILWFVAAMSCMAMTLRLAIRGSFDGVLGLQLGNDERRLMMAHAMYAGMMFMVFIIAAFLATLVVLVFVTSQVVDTAAIENDPEAMAQAAEASLQTPLGQFTSVISTALVALPVLWLSARLVTFPAATIARNKIMIFETWKWTKGVALPIIGAIIVAIGPFWLVYQFGQWLATAIFDLPWMMFWNEETILSVTRLQAFIIGGMAGLFSIPMSLVSAGLSAFMYRGFDPDLSD
ncbi:hypothetical protein [Ponticaulis profundi]|uniref:Uncharacterized protein n=1 Tax=Ponticaulis profundi TaxID=2665222 RepID=A0ABW1SDV3_9PROT